MLDILTHMPLNSLRTSRILEHSQFCYRLRVCYLLNVQNPELVCGVPEHMRITHSICTKTLNEKRKSSRSIGLELGNLPDFHDIAKCGINRMAYL